MSRVDLSNDNMLVRLDSYARVSGIFSSPDYCKNYASYIGHKVGVFIDGQMLWLGSEGWRTKTNFSHGALIAHTIAVNDDAGVLLEFDDFVGSDVNLFGRYIHVVNLREEPREVKLFLHQAFSIDQTLGAEDYVRFLEDKNTVVHYGGDGVFAVGGATCQGKSFDYATVGRFGDSGLEGTWRDAEDGRLMNNKKDQGKTDSTIGFRLDLPANSSTRINYWFVMGNSLGQTVELVEDIYTSGIDGYFARTVKYWQKWLRPAFKVAQKIDPSYRRSFIDCLLFVKSQILATGSINTLDDAALKPSCKLYDAASALYPLVRLGYKKEAVDFFEYCITVLSRNTGWLGSSYSPSGALSGELDIQEDNGASMLFRDWSMVLFTLCEFDGFDDDDSRSNYLYENLARPLAGLLVDELYKLPDLNHLSSYLLRLICVALNQASEMARDKNDENSMIKWQLASDELSSFIDNPEAANIESAESFYGLFMFGAGPSRDHRLSSAIDKCSPRTVIDRLWIAQYYIYMNDHTSAKAILMDIRSSHSSRTGIIADGSHSSTWNSAEYINTLLDAI